MKEKIFNRSFHKGYLNRIIQPNIHKNFLYQQSVDLIIEQLEMFSKTFENGLFYGFGIVEPCQLWQKKCKKLTFANVIDDYRAQIIYDEDEFSLSENTYDLIISNLNLHFINNIENALNSYLKALKPKGLFIAVILGENTLTELRQAALNTDVKYYNYVSPKVIPMITTKDLAKIAVKAGFSMPTTTLENITAMFSNFNNLLNTIRSAGQINSLCSKFNHFYGRNYFNYLNKEYINNFTDKNGKLIATFDYIFLSASKN